MSVPVHTLNKEQRFWYANLVISAILADDEISPSEVDFLKQVIVIVSDAEKKKELMGRISSKKKSPLTDPPNIAKEILAAIFIELSLIMISDLDFAEDEKAFLKTVADLFRFEKTYFLELMRWAEEGLQWKNSQQDLLSGGDKTENFQVSLGQLNPEQRKWYAQALIATIMLDGAIDEMELSFLKAAVSFVDNKKDQMELMGYVRNKMAPRLKRPPDMSEAVLIHIFIEVIRIVSADESLSYAEQAHLKQISDLCGFSADQFEKSVAWCNRGIAWMQNKNPLITNCKVITKKNLGSLSGSSGLAVNAENSSILNREFSCFVCGSKQKVPAFQLKPQTQEANRNIFGITAYLGSLEGRDYIDFNKVRVITCPTCLFSSFNKDLFKKSDKEKTPEILANTKFRTTWLKDVKNKQSKLGGLKEELYSLKPSVEAVIKSYELAIQAANILGVTNNDESQKWQSVTLLMTLAEIQMNDGDVEAAESSLEKARERADSLFKNAANVTVSFKAARLLLFIGLFRDDIRTAGTYLDFLREYQFEKKDGLSTSEQNVLRKVYGEVKKVMEDRSEYTKDQLMGFHKNI